MERYFNIFSGAVGVVGGFLAYWLGGLDILLKTLIAVMAIDYITGVIAAAIQKTLNSEIGFKGIGKKVILLLLVALAFVIETGTGGAVQLREMVIMFFVANEGLSIIENAGKAGVPLPEAIIKALEQLRGREKDE